MISLPIVRFYNLNKSLVSIANWGPLHRYLYKFSYKYAETGPDSSEVTLVFNSTSVDLTFLQPGMGYVINWGYAAGSLSNDRKVVIEKASYKYSKAGFVVSLQMVPFADRTIGGVIRDPSGTLFEDALKDAANNAPDGLEIRFTDTGGDVTRGIKKKGDAWEFDYLNEEGKSGAELLADKVASDIGELVAAEKRYIERLSWFSREWEIQYNSNYHGKVIIPGGPDGRRTPVDPTKNELVDTNREIATVIASLLDKKGSHKIFQIRDGKVTITEPALAAPAVLTFNSFDNIISFDFTKGDKESRPIQSVTTVADATTGKVETHQGIVGRSFTVDFYGNYDNPETKVDETKVLRGTIGLMEQDGNYYATDENLTLAIPITRGEFEKYEKKSELRKEYLADKSREEESTLKGYRIHISKEALEQLDKNRDQLAWSWDIQQSGMSLKDLNSPYLDIRHSGRSYQDASAQAVRDEMDKMFYNGKLTLKVPGDPSIEDNINLVLNVNSDALDGTYHIDESEHVISKAGYTTTIVAYRIITDYKRIENRVLKQFGEEWEEEGGTLLTKQAQLDYIEAFNEQGDQRRNSDSRMRFYESVTEGSLPQVVDVKELNVMQTPEVPAYEDYTKGMDELTLRKAAEAAAEKEKEKLDGPGD